MKHPVNNMYAQLSEDKILTVVCTKEVARKERRGIIDKREPVVGQGKVQVDVVLFGKRNKRVQALDTIRTSVDSRVTVFNQQ
jgi:hypothetical protein